MKQIIKIIIFCLVLVMTGCGNSEVEVGLSTLELSENEVPVEEGEQSPVEEFIMISVYICGAVKTPGVYEFAVGDRLTQGIEKAGGFTEEAQREYLNLAQLLTDGEKIYVPSKEEVNSGYTVASNMNDAGVDGSGKININTATKEQLMGLTGVGASRALSIISYREINGNFSTIEDIMKISGIKDAVFNTIKDNITV